MNKPTPITKEYVEYLNTLTDEELSHLVKREQFSDEEKSIIIQINKALTVHNINEYKKFKVGDDISYNIDGEQKTGKIKSISQNGIASIVPNSKHYDYDVGIVMISLDNM